MEISQIGPYRIERHLGSGGMGAVYLAWDNRLKRKVAIKSIHPGKELSDERLERLRREAQAIAGINHPAVTQVYDILDQDGREFIVMEYVEGQSLTTLLTEAPLTPSRAIEVAQQIAEGLTAAHEQGVIHRDLKPENVMIDPSGRVKILDFGLAKSIAEDIDQESLTEEGMVMGTSRAMSPEQAKGQEVDARSDLFSLGSIIYELATGEHPFQASNPLETMQRIVRHRPRSVLKLRPGVPEELSLLVERLLEKDKTRRPGSAKEVSIALRALSEGDSTKTSNLTTLDRLTATARRRRNFRRLWPITFAVIGLIAAGVFAWRWHESTRPIETTAIAILKPAVEPPSEDPRAQLIVDATRTAIINAVASLEGLVVIDPRSVDDAGSETAEIARAVAADELLVPTCTSLGDTWSITTTELTAQGIVLGAEAIEVPGNEVSELAGAIASTIRRLYPDKQPNNIRYVSTATSEEWETYFRIGRRIDAGRNIEDALEELSSLRTRSPRFLEPSLREVTLARFLYERTSESRYLDRGRAALQDARMLAPDDHRTLMMTAELAFITRDYDVVERAILAGRASAPAEEWLPQYEARLANARGEPGRAREILAALCERRKSLPFLYDLAQHDYRNGDPASSIKILNQALELVPGHPSAKAFLAKMELYHGDLEKATILLQELALEHPGPYYLESLGLAQMLLGQYEAAASSFEALLDLKPSSPMSLMNLADCLALQRKDDVANEFYRKALQVADSDPNPDHPNVLTVRSQCLAHLGRSSEAVQAIQRRLAVAPDDLNSHFDAALVYSVIGERTSAVVSARRAVELGLEPRWLELPWFDVLRDSNDFRALLHADRP